MHHEYQKLTAMMNIQLQFVNACKFSNIDVVKEIIAGTDSDTLTVQTIGAAVCESCKNRNVELFNVVMGVRSDIERTSVLRYTDGQGRRALHYAAETGSLDIVKRLVREGVPINCKDIDSGYPLHLAIQEKHADVVKFLLQKGANAKTINKYGENALHIAATTGDAKIATIIVEHSPHCLDTTTARSLGGNSALHEAVKHDNIGMVDYLCNTGGTVDIRNALNSTPLHEAAACDKAQAAEVLLKHGAAIDAKENNNKEPLHVAMYAKHLNVIKVLVEAGANVNAHDGHGMAPLHIATIAMECSEIMEFIIQNGGDVNLRSIGREETPIIVAASMGDVDGIKTLVKHGCDIGLCDNNGSSVLHKAICIPQRNWAKNAEATLELIIRCGAVLNVVDHHGYTPLHACAFQTSWHLFNMRTLELLVSAGAYLGLPVVGRESETISSRAQRNSPLCWLVWHMEVEAAEYLVKSGWDVSRETWLTLPGNTDTQNRLHKHILDFTQRPQTLGVYCRNTVRTQLRKASGHREILSRIERLELPGLLKKFLKLEYVHDSEFTMDESDSDRPWYFAW